MKYNDVARQYLILAEQYKRMAFFQKHEFVHAVIEKILPFIKGSAAVFGSYAKGLQHKDSDLDIFVAGTYNPDNVRTISETYGIDVSVKCYPQKLFSEKAGTDVLIREVFGNHVVILNMEYFVEIANGQNQLVFT